MNTNTLLPEHIMTEQRQQGEQDGQAEAEMMLAAAAQQKMAPLTKREVNALHFNRMTERLAARKQGAVNEEWWNGWCLAFANRCLQALRAAPDPDSWIVTPLPTPCGEMQPHHMSFSFCGLPQ